MVLTNSGRAAITTSISPLFTYAGIGLDSTATSAADTELFGGGTTIDACDVTTGWTQSGVGSAVTANTTAAAFLQGTACLNLPTSGAGTASWTKVISTTDLASKKVALWYYIDNASELTDSASALTIYLGSSDLANSYAYYFPRDDIANGWNSFLIDVNSYSAILGSGATTSSITGIKLTALVDVQQVTTDMRMDYWRSYAAGTLGIADSLTTNVQTTGDYYFKNTHTITASQSNGLPIVEAGDSDNSTLYQRTTFATLNKGASTILQIDKYYYVVQE
jgi:hypothetical protein